MYLFLLHRTPFYLICSRFVAVKILKKDPFTYRLEIRKIFLAVSARVLSNFLFFFINKSLNIVQQWK